MRKLLVAVSVVSIGITGCMSTRYLNPDNLRFQDKTDLKTQVLNVIRDQKLCHDDTTDQQNCPIQFYIDDIKAGTFFIDNSAQYYLKPETYNLKVKNCTEECTVCETELNPAEIKDHKIILSVDDQGLPFMLNTDQQLICEKNSKQLAAKNKPVNFTPLATTIKLDLAADSLFKFDGSALQDLLPKGRQEVIGVAEKIRTGYVSVDQINLVGHTDRLGDETYNQQLGQKRANTVKAVLVEHGVTPNLITTTSAGESEPVTDGCYGVKPGAALKDCLQSDRRVTLEITGIAK